VYVLLPGLVGYMALLILGAWPEPLRPGFVERPHRLANAVLNSLTIYPGQDVFKGAETFDFKLKAWCIAVVGHTDTGDLRVLYERGDDCVRPSFRWHADLYNVTLQQLLIFSDKVQSSSHHQSTSILLTNIADYYCHSTLINHGDVAQVSILSVQVFKSYTTGEIARRTTLDYHWNCNTNAPGPQPWPGIKVIYLHSAQGGQWLYQVQ
jgi:hypothetical protein